MQDNWNAMASGNILQFRLRDYFPNFHTIRDILRDSPSGESTINQPGALSPELEIRMEGDDFFNPVPISRIDAAILCQPDHSEVSRYLNILYHSKQNDKDAIREKSLLREKYLRILRKKFGPIVFIEHENVVPSITDKPYDELILSQKGKVLLNLYQEGYPVPDFCIITSSSFLAEKTERDNYLRETIFNLEKMTGEKLGDPDQALVFAMRCATPQYIPGLMPTYLNIGVTKTSFRSLEKRYGRSVANKIYLNNLQSVCQILNPQQEFFRSPQEERTPDNDDIEDQISRLFQKITILDERILYDAHYQVKVFMGYSHSFFTRNQDLIYTFQQGHTTYPSLILQKMVWTIRNQDSYPGVLYSRHPRTGLGMQIESVREIFGEEIMTGTIHAEQKEYFNREEIKEEFPAIYHFTPMLPKLEVKLKSPATIEFAVESYNGISLFAILQLNMSELTGRSTMLTAIDLYQKKIISKKRVIQLIKPYHLRQIFSERIDDDSMKSLTLFGYGVSVLPRSAVSTRIYFTMARALEAKKKGEKVCLCKDNFIPSETIFMAELDVILSMNPLAIHVVTACLGYGIPAFINLKNHHMRLEENAIINAENVTLHEGDWITVSSKHHCIYIGKATFKPARFQKYLEGQALEMELKEEKVFVNMALAYRSYQEILNTLKTEEAMTLPDVVKLIRNDYEHQPVKASEFVNGWFDLNAEHYYTEILKSGLGSHLDQHKIYTLLTTKRKIQFFKNIIRICQSKKISGFSAGAFMLGRFLCQPHHVAFWKAFDTAEIIFLLNEYILFEKYMQVLSELGERHLSRTRNKILTEDLNTITLALIDPEIFIPLKLCSVNWQVINDQIGSKQDHDTQHLINQLQKPYGILFDYDRPWSFERLKSICDTEKIEIPDRAAT
ncbi:MAG: hypothetical protein M0P58_01785 [Bacteroidales bacterium]|nr:hypothetical protein [Bacteroidales bacterium]